MKTRKMLFLLLLAASSAYSRDPPISFPPMTENASPEIFTRCEALLDQTIYPALAFSNTPIGDALGYLAIHSPEYDPTHSGLSVVYNTALGGTHETLLPPTPGTITLSLTNATYRMALDEICRLANLSWQLTPSVLVARPECFMEPEENGNNKQEVPGSRR